jgi:hypothetical protein
VPFRLALAAAGFRAEPDATGPDGRALFSRPLAGDLPVLPDFVVAPP